MVHPIHIPGLQFLVIERSINSQFTEGYETVLYGYVDEGWKRHVDNDAGGAHQGLTPVLGLSEFTSIIAIVSNRKTRE